MFRVLVFICFVLLTSCSKDLCDCFTATGSIKTEERQLDVFTSIRIESNINLILSQDTDCHLKVECGSGIIGDIYTEVNDGRLRIWNANKCNWVRDPDPQINVYVYYKDLQDIEYSSSGNIICADTIYTTRFTLNVRDGAGNINLVLKADTAYINEHDGTADITIQGLVRSQYIYNNGLGPINALAVSSLFTYVHNQGTNDCFVNCRDRLEARIDYYGNIYYLGEPAFIVSWISGKGKLIKYAE